MLSFWFSLGADHDGEGLPARSCPDRNFIMAALQGTPNNLNNRFLFSCCSQRSFYVTANLPLYVHIDYKAGCIWDMEYSMEPCIIYSM